ncbi:SepM family pheromone-processing serine protease [Kurthia massiliensis]|uniref:SepM family pheromone-processing serine protease n=1 Tax=Kurthia massiliensis TaxID=1033739 RepID=UPI00028913AE|nr:SepM family pheromone-processing serine protease [Kurthia massiliensis]
MSKKSFFTWVIMIAIFAFGFMYPLHYYIMKPGNAYNLTDYVAVKDGDKPGEGELNMMTISMGVASPFTYAWAKMHKDSQDIMTEKEVLGENKSNDDYNERQLHLMTDSQFNAKYVAFKKTGHNYTVKYNGIYVAEVVKKSAVDGILQVGDEVTKIDDIAIKKNVTLTNYIAKKEKGDTVRITFKRDGKLKTKKVTLKAIPGSEGRIGLGISFEESKSIKTDPTVKIDAENIGGPSAGLMFTLEIIDQLTKGDLTKGYNIAGTGTMNEDGTVGRIGGIDKKVMAADKADVDIFFAPEDDISAYEKYAPELHVKTNYEDAKATAKKIDSDMKIVPVKTVDDALDYLEALKEK